MLTISSFAGWIVYWTLYRKKIKMNIFAFYSTVVKDCQEPTETIPAVDAVGWSSWPYVVRSLFLPSSRFYLLVRWLPKHQDCSMVVQWLRVVSTAKFANVWAGRSFHLQLLLRPLKPLEESRKRPLWQFFCTGQQIHFSFWISHISNKQLFSRTCGVLWCFRIGLLADPISSCGQTQRVFLQGRWMEKIHQ